MWSGLVILAVIVGFLGILFTEGIGKVIEIFSISNVINYLFIFILLSPAIGAYILVKHLKKKVEKAAFEKGAEQISTSLEGKV